jgi:predicted acylesterase/phospholipase RssA
MDHLGGVMQFAGKLNGNNKNNGIRTTSENEPRLLLVAADIKTGDSVVFDSVKSKIMVEHVLANTAIPINYPYPYMEINGRQSYVGGILSNTPVRELISEHTRFWAKNMKMN